MDRQKYRDAESRIRTDLSYVEAHRKELGLMLEVYPPSFQDLKMLLDEVDRLREAAGEVEETS